MFRLSAGERATQNIGENGSGFMRLGVFGGTFDPVHLGHLILAEQCREQARLDQVLFIPAPRPPHKQDRPLTPFAQRAEMLALALAGNPAFRVDELEKDRPGPSYTVNTLEELRHRSPEADLSLLIGSDSLTDLPLWYSPARILELACLSVMARAGSPVMSPDELRQSLSISQQTPVRMQVLEAPLIDIASRDLRRRVLEGRSIRYLVPRAVEAYIQEKRLYAS
jgi:nicotinate-nucleotide adenylyltransferase